MLQSKIFSSRELLGIDTLANAVKVTLGPKVEMLLKYLELQEQLKMVLLCKEIELKDKFENMGAQMVRENKRCWRWNYYSYRFSTSNSKRGIKLLLV